MDTKPFYLSLTFWGLVVTVIATLLAKFGYKLSDSLRADAAQMLLDIAGFIVGPLMALIGRVRATKPLSVAGGVKSATTYILAAAMLATTAGCFSLNKDSNLTPEQKVNNLKRDYELALPLITAFFDAGILPGSLADAFIFARQEARAFIEDALIQAKAGALDWEFYYTRAVAALGRYLQYKNSGEVEAKRRGLDPKHLPATRPVAIYWRAPWNQFSSHCLA